MRDEKGRWIKGSQGHLGYKLSDEQRKKLSDANKGKVPWMAGKKHSDESKALISKARKGVYAGENHSMWGKHHTEESRKKMSESLKGREVWNKGLKAPFGEGQDHRSWKGGVVKGSKDRYWVYCPGHPEARLLENKYAIRARKEWYDAYGEIPEGNIIHHIDGDTMNDDISNLDCLSRAEHASLHHTEGDNNK